VRVSGPSQVKDVPIDDRSHGASAPSTRSSASASTTCARLPYEGTRGIERAAARPDRVRLGPGRGERQVIALAKDGASVTLEPAGQLELSGAPLETIHQTCCEPACPT
jgi:glutamate--cysteine ligase